LLTTVVPVADAIRVELEAMAYRDGLKSKWSSPDSAPLRYAFRDFRANFPRPSSRQTIGKTYLRG
jgi:hypothetical protein